MALTKFDPRVKIDSDFRRCVTLPPELFSIDRIHSAMNELQRYFPIPYNPIIDWKTGPIMIGAENPIRLLLVDDDGALIHPILGHPKIPIDVFQSAVFLAMLMVKAHNAQSETIEIFDNQDLCFWIDTNMQLIPATEFLANLFAKFGVWLRGI